MPQKFFAFVFVVIMILSGCQSKATSGRNDALQAADEKSPKIAEVNGTALHKAAYDRFYKYSISDLELQQSQADSDLLQSSRLDEFIRRHLIVQEATEKGVTITDEELRREVSDQRQQTNVEGNGKTPTTLGGSERSAEIGNDLLIWKFYKTEILKDVAVAPEEVEKYYKDHPKDYPQEPSFCVREIKVDDSKKAEELRKQVLDKPADFQTIARENSSSPSKGNVMCYRQKELPPVLENAAMPLKVGGISTVVKSDFGNNVYYHIFQMVKKEDAPLFDKIRKQVEEAYLRSKNQSLIDNHLEQTVKSAKIKVYADKLGFNYTGRWKN